MICDAPVAIHAPGHETTIRAALGIVSAATGVRFSEGPDPVLTFRLGQSPALGWYTGDAITVDPALRPGRLLVRIYLHELGHWLGMEHNDHAHSLMNLTGWPIIPAFTARDLTEARRLTAYCR